MRRGVSEGIHHEMDARFLLLSFAPHGNEGPRRALCLCREFRSGAKVADALAVVDVDPKSRGYSTITGHGRNAQQGRRASSFRLERLQLVPVPQCPACSCRATLSHRSGVAIIAHPRAGHEARPRKPENRQGHRGGGDRRKGKLLAPAHHSLRTRGHLRRLPGRRAGQVTRGHFPDGP